MDKVTFKPDRFTLYKQFDDEWAVMGSGYLNAVDIDDGFNIVAVGSRISCGSISSRDAWYTTKVTKIVDYTNGIVYAKTSSGSLYKVVPFSVKEK